MSRKAEKLFAKMKNSQSGWHSRHLEALYQGFGFEIRKGGGSHRRVRHPKYPFIQDTFVAKPGELSKGYIEDAIKNIEWLKRLEAGQGDSGDEQN